jgi:hypothetical protein
MEGFDRFWEAYGKMVGRAACEKLWPTAVEKAGGDIERIVLHAKRYRLLSLRVEDGRYQMQPERWLRDERWNDEDLQRKVMFTPEEKRRFALASSPIDPNRGQPKPDPRPIWENCIPQQDED